MGQGETNSSTWDANGKREQFLKKALDQGEVKIIHTDRTSVCTVMYCTVLYSLTSFQAFPKWDRKALHTQSKVKSRTNFRQSTVGSWCVTGYHFGIQLTAQILSSPFHRSLDFDIFGIEAMLLTLSCTNVPHLTFTKKAPQQSVVPQSHLFFRYRGGRTPTERGWHQRFPLCLFPASERPPSRPPITAVKTLHLDRGRARSHYSSPAPLAGCPRH